MKTCIKSLIAPLCAGVLLAAAPLAAQSAPDDGMNPGYDRNNRHTADQGSQNAREQTTIHGRVATDARGAELPRAERRFFKKAAGLGDKEVTLSRLAAERASNPQVRAFADEMVRAHTAANSELAALATRKGYVDKDRDLLDRRELEKKWRDKKADDFDEDYIEAMVECHEDTVSLLEKAARSKDADIAAYAAKLLPEVKTHLARAEQIEKTLD